MISVEEYRELKDRVEGLQRKADKAAGVASELRRRLKDEFGFSTLEEAEEALTKMEKELAKKEEALEKEYASFVEGYGDVLD